MSGIGSSTRRWRAFRGGRASRPWTVLLTLLVIGGAVAGAGVAWGPLAQFARFGMPGARSLATVLPSIPGVLVPPPPALAQAASPQGCIHGLPPVSTQPLTVQSARGAAGVRGEVALTFDDGPSPLYTPYILDELKAAGAQATFFVVGRHALLYPALVRAEWLAGNAIGNHTFGHEYIGGMRPDQIRANLAATTAAIRVATGDPCVWLFRPPFGDLPWGSSAAREVRREGFVIVNWDTLARDWTRPGASVIAQRIIGQLHAGAIILLHDSAPDTQIQDRSQTVAALPAILAALRARGLRAVTLPKLLLDAGLVRPAAPPVAPPEPWHSLPLLAAGSFAVATDPWRWRL